VYWELDKSRHRAPENLQSVKNHLNFFFNFSNYFLIGKWLCTSFAGVLKSLSGLNLGCLHPVARVISDDVGDSDVA
jgi:hypothetical protein